MKRKSNQVGYKTVGFKPSRLLVIVILSVLIIAIAFLGYSLFKSLKTYTFKESAIYYVNGISYDINVGDKVELNTEDEAIIKFQEGMDINVYTLPAYFKDTDSLLVIKPMSIFPKGISSYNRGMRLENFTKLSLENNSLTISKKARKTSEQMSFMFDGEDTYVIFDYATLKIGEDEIKLSPLSYIIAIYDSYVLYYDYENDLFVDYTFDDFSEYMPVNLAFSDGMVINCDIDRVTAGDDNFMLSSAIDTLPNIF